MGRLDLRPLRVHQTATQLMAADRTTRMPPWYHVVGSVTPSSALVRTQPVDHGFHRSGQSQQLLQQRRRRKPSKMFQPTSIRYEEDALRAEFFKDHPWELARPRVVLEDGGKDWEQDDWRRVKQKERGLSGESVVQRQMYLMHHNPNLSPAAAYDIARKEFYALRLKQDVERRVAEEEALATGAYFGKTSFEIGQELEDKQFEEWKKWAEKEVEAMEVRRASMYTGNENASMDLEEGEPETEAAEGMVEEEALPAKGQTALGGSRLHP